jgi:hypothetical protein
VSRLVAAVRQYRHCDGVALYAADGNWWLTPHPISHRLLPSRDRDTIEPTIFDGPAIE